jgi:hypothetical protein
VELVIEKSVRCGLLWDVPFSTYILAWFCNPDDLVGIWRES